MFKHQVILWCLFGLCVAKDVKFTKCGANGFICSTAGKLQIITYRCPIEEKDLLFKINDFGYPPNDISLIIENCLEITVSFQCSSQVIYIKSMFIRNIGKLKIHQDPQYQTQLPFQVTLKNVNYIKDIPSFAFSKIDVASRNVECFTPLFDLKFLHFENVGIGNFQSNGIYMPNNGGNVFFNKVNIGKMRRSAISINMSTPYIFQMKNSAIGIVGNQAMQVTGGGMIFSKNTFVEISAAGIGGPVDFFYFNENAIGTLQSQGISITSQTVWIWKNVFKYMITGALEKISPGPTAHSLDEKASYKFYLNRIDSMEERSFHPDFQAYEMTPTEMFVKTNTVLCSCENSGWLVSQIGRTSTSIERFYEKFIAKKDGNYCSSSCSLPIAYTERMVHDGKCEENVSVEWLCQNQTTK
nr:uncharacterized protein LOC111508898 [Leptinotarsa decemlineata]